MLIWIVTLILAATLVLLVTEKIPVDLTGLMLIAVLAVTGILTPLEAVAGFANPAVRHDVDDRAARDRVADGSDPYREVIDLIEVE